MMAPLTPDPTPLTERILVVDDEPGICRTFCELLTRWGFEADEAAGGRDALTRLADRSYSLALIDLRMPEMDGLDLLRVLRRELREMSVIVVSGGGGMADVIEALRLGAYDFLLKPITDLALLRRSVERGVERSRLRHARAVAEAALRDTVAAQALQLQRLQLLQRVGEALQGTFDTTRLCHMILTAATAGCALGFNRAALFLLNPERTLLEGHMGLGPASAAEAGQIWTALGQGDWPLAALLQREPPPPGPFDRAIRAMRIAATDPDRRDAVLTSLWDRRGVELCPETPAGPLTDCLRTEAGMQHGFVAPLLAGGKPLGILVADNAFTGWAIDGERARLLQMLAHQAGMALDNAQAYQCLAENLRQLRETQAALVAAERLAALGRMAAQVAHEIRNPLVSIGGFARRIQRHFPGDGEMPRACRMVVEQVDRLEHLLHNITTFTRSAPAAGTVTNLNTLVSTLADLLAEPAQATGVTLALTLDPTLPPVHCNRAQLQQVLLNLAKNALEAMPHGGTLALTTRGEGAQVHLEVRDTGVGMDARVLACAIEPFFTTKSIGTGLGLSVAREIVLAHEGGLFLASSPDAGTTVEIVLPVRLTAEDHPPVAGNMEAPPERSGSPPAALAQAGSSLRTAGDYH